MWGHSLKFLPSMKNKHTLKANKHGFIQIHFWKTSVQKTFLPPLNFVVPLPMCFSGPPCSDPPTGRFMSKADRVGRIYPPPPTPNHPPGPRATLPPLPTLSQVHTALQPCLSERRGGCHWTSSLTSFVRCQILQIWFFFFNFLIGN